MTLCVFSSKQATLVLTAIGTRPSVLLFAVMFLTAFLSMWIGNPVCLCVLVLLLLCAEAVQSGAAKKQ